VINVSPYAVAGCGAISAFLIAFSTFPAKSPMAARLKKLERIDEKSVAMRFTLIEQIVSKEQHSRVQQRLIEAGWYGVTPIAMTLRGIGALGIGAVACVMSLILFDINVLGILIGAFAGLVAWRAPSIMLSRAVKTRKESIQRNLPDFLDFLGSTVQAGLALNAALVQAAAQRDVRAGQEEEGEARDLGPAGLDQERRRKADPADDPQRQDQVPDVLLERLLAPVAQVPGAHGFELG